MGTSRFAAIVRLLTWRAGGNGYLSPLCPSIVHALCPQLKVTTAWTYVKPLQAGMITGRERIVKQHSTTNVCKTPATECWRKIEGELQDEPTTVTTTATTTTASKQMWLVTLGQGACQTASKKIGA